MARRQGGNAILSTDYQRQWHEAVKALEAHVQIEDSIENILRIY